MLSDWRTGEFRVFELGNLKFSVGGSGIFGISGFGGSWSLGLGKV